jgi:hypothetical protein
LGHHHYEKKQNFEKGQDDARLKSPCALLWRELAALLFEDKDATRVGCVLAAHAVMLEGTDYLEDRVCCCAMPAYHREHTARLVLATAGETRIHQGAHRHTAVLPTGCALSQGMLSSGDRLYMEKMDTKKSQRNAGPLGRNVERQFERVMA